MPTDRGWFGLPKVPPEERERALRDPGPGWSEWLTSSFAKTYLGLGFLIADAILLASWLGPPPSFVGLVGSGAVALYLEYLLWQYLWYVPRIPDDGASRRSEAGLPWSRDSEGLTLGRTASRFPLRALIHPVRFGRWTEPARRRGNGIPPIPSKEPDPREFL